MNNRNGLAKCVGCLVLAGAMALAASGCMSNGTTGETSMSPKSTASSAASIVVSASQDHVVTFPSLYFDLTGTSKDPEKTLKEAGYTDVESADDGSWTATVRGEDYDALVNDVYELVKDFIGQVVGDKDYPNATAVDYDEQLATVTVSFSTADISPQEELLPKMIGNAVCMYQQIAGLPVGCDVILVGPDGTAIMETAFPQQSSSSSSGSSSEQG